MMRVILLNSLFIIMLGCGESINNPKHNRVEEFCQCINSSAGKDRRQIVESLKAHLFKTNPKQFNSLDNLDDILNETSVFLNLIESDSLNFYYHYQPMIFSSCFYKYSSLDIKDLELKKEALFSLSLNPNNRNGLFDIKMELYDNPHPTCDNEFVYFYLLYSYSLAQNDRYINNRLELPDF